MSNVLVARVLVAVSMLACGAWVGTPAIAQSGADAIESDPLKCWWRANKAAVHVGEQFALTVTCGVVEASPITVVAPPNQFDASALQLTPFEVVGGTRHEDIQAPPWRYFQHEYTVRLFGEEFFGQDIEIPSMNLTYNIRSAEDASEGRDQTYVLPPLPMRILSLVPAGATDIRDASHESFGAIETRRFRATVALVAAGIGFGFCLIFAGLVAMRILGRYRGRTHAAARPFGADAVFRGCVQQLRRLKADVARDGWTPDLARRAVAVFRIAGAVALGRPVAQALVAREVSAREGQLLLRKGFLRKRHAVVSASLTADAMTTEVGNGAVLSESTRATLEQIQNSLRAFNTAAYGRNGHVDTTNLDSVLDEGIMAVRRLRLTKLWPVETVVARTRSLFGQ